MNYLQVEYLLVSVSVSIHDNNGFESGRPALQFENLCQLLLYFWISLIEIPYFL